MRKTTIEISWEDIVKMYENGCLSDEVFNILKAKIDKSGAKKQNS